MSVIYARARDQWREMHAEYRAEVERRYLLAEEATNGYMVNRRGRALGLTGWDLFNSRANNFYAFASEELLEHVAISGRVTLADFETAWLDAQDLHGPSEGLLSDLGGVFD
ncbi:MAG: hypothetical protein Q4G34_00240 [Micrococcus sp.]|nr:hypothetical protein [Micrococcus sp.]